MPSPFPGVDPFLESQRWEQFHFQFIAEVARQLVPQVRPRYEVAPEQRVYIERRFDEELQQIHADVGLLRHKDAEPSGSDYDLATATVGAPATYTLPMPEEQREAYLVIRDRHDLRVVTILEILSPTNKAPGSDGRELYLSKRLSVLQSATNLVEIDLLRGGRRLPTVERLQPADYYAFVCRAGRRPQADVYAWTLRQRLPGVPIPLATDDQDVRLDLQSVFTRAYDDSGYDYLLDYSQRVAPPLNDADAEWVQETVNGRGA